MDPSGNRPPLRKSPEMKKGRRQNFFTLLYKNNFNKNSEPQILYFEIGFSVNIHASLKLIMKNSQGDHKKHFKHIKGAKLKTGLKWVQK